MICIVLIEKGTVVLTGKFFMNMNIRLDQHLNFFILKEILAIRKL